MLTFGSCMGLNSIKILYYKYSIITLFEFNVIDIFRVLFLRIQSIMLYNKLYLLLIEIVLYFSTTCRLCNIISCFQVIVLIKRTKYTIPFMKVWTAFWLFRQLRPWNMVLKAHTKGLLLRVYPIPKPFVWAQEILFWRFFN